MIQLKVYDDPPTFERRKPAVERSRLTVTNIAHTRSAGQDAIEVVLAFGDARTASLRVSTRDFLHFGYFLLAIRGAMDAGAVPAAAIDRGRLRESWEPRCTVLESSLCTAGCRDDHASL